MLLLWQDNPNRKSKRTYQKQGWPQCYHYYCVGCFLGVSAGRVCWPCLLGVLRAFCSCVLFFVRVTLRHSNRQYTKHYYGVQVTSHKKKYDSVCEAEKTSSKPIDRVYSRTFSLRLPHETKYVKVGQFEFRHGSLARIFLTHFSSLLYIIILLLYWLLLLFIVVAFTWKHGALL